MTTNKYRNQPFGQRLATMGDTAEDVYKNIKPLGNTLRFGFRRPKGMKFSLLPETFRHMPDFITPTYLVEVMGLGRDGILKSVKPSKYEALKLWDKWAKQGELLGLVLFIWNSSKQQFIILSWKNLVSEVQYSKRKHGIQKFESDNNEYYRLDWERLVEQAATIGVYDENEQE